MVAYIDISSVSYVIPLVVGIFVAIGSWMYIHFRRAKSKISEKLGIDENAGKEVEDDIVITDDESAEESAGTVGESEETANAESEDEKK